ncbi:MAG TPA: hypothetical protein VE932_02095 [Patescibacteria group bacterium]|nr:hypothetical protein [Patescibacteria group bacterium]
MDARIFVGTGSGLWLLQGDTARPVEALAGRSVTALALGPASVWAVADGSTLWALRDGAWTTRAAIDGPPATCVAPTHDGVLVGTAQARLFRLTGAGLAPVRAFEAVEGRDAWYTPWGDPADVRSIAVALDGVMHVNIHVGGVARSRDGGASWAPTVDIEKDVHQVLAHPSRAEIVMVAAAEGFGLSRDGGDSWRFATAGLHAHYLRAVTVAGDHVLVSASTGFRGRRSAIYRRPLDGGRRFERCSEGLPAWFDDNIDTACLAAAGPLVVFGTGDGRVYRSVDAGARWELALKGLPPVGCVAVG